MIFWLGGLALLTLGVILAFKDLWSPLILLGISVMAFYRAGEKFWGSVALFLAFLVAMRMASNVLWPVGLALIIAFIFLPVVRRLERWHIPRSVSALVIILGMFSGSILIGGLISYQVYLQLKDILEKVQDILIFNQKLDTLLSSYGISPQITEAMMELRKYLTDALPGMQEIIGNVSSLLSTSLEMLFSILVGLVIGFYVLKDTETLANEINALIPDEFRGILSEMYQLLAQYFRGQVTVAFIVGVFVGLSLQILGIKYGFLIGFFAGVFNLVPNIGFALTVVVGSLIILVSESNLLISFVKFAVVMGLDQLLETLVLTPRILGKSVGLHPVLVMLSLIVGATLFGALGVILAVPAAAFLRSLWINRVRQRL
ncbi:MAG: AI-2E family transporter [Thermotogae bacterium]|nr:AI-2E family transporter [Thermotogota bacterium]